MLVFSDRVQCWVEPVGVGRRSKFKIHSIVLSLQILSSLDFWIISLSLFCIYRDWTTKTVSLIKVLIDSTSGQTFERFTTFLTPDHVLFGKKEHPSQQNRRYFLGVIYRKGFILVPRNNSFRAVRKIRFCFSSNNLFAICGREKQRTDISDDLAFNLDLVLIFTKNQFILALPTSHFPI